MMMMRRTILPPRIPMPSSRALGDATNFIPCEGSVRPIGRVTPRVIPAVGLAIIVHEGSHANIDLAYGSLATYVAHHAIAVEGPLRICLAYGDWLAYLSNRLIWPLALSRYPMTGHNPRAPVDWPVDLSAR